MGKTAEVYFHNKKERRNKCQIISALLKDGYINEFVYFNLLKSKFKKSEVEGIEKVCRENLKKGYRKELDSSYIHGKITAE